MHRCAPMGIIWRHSDGTDSGAPDPRIFIQCVNGWYPISNELWSHGLDDLCRDVNTTVRVDILPGTDGLFITEYLNNDGRRIRIIGKYFVNGSVQFTGFPEDWGSNLPYISITYILDTNIGRGWKGTYSTSSTATIIWGITINTSTDNSPRSTLHSCVVYSRYCDDFLHYRHLEFLWRLYNPSDEYNSRLNVRNNDRFRGKNQHRDFLMSDTNNFPCSIGFGEKLQINCPKIGLVRHLQSLCLNSF